MYLIKAIAFADSTECPHSGHYLQSFDFEYADGLGYGTFTPDPKRAKSFTSFAEALSFWGTQSKTKPLRDDGRPNKPLTALSIAVETWDGGGDDDECPDYGGYR